MRRTSRPWTWALSLTLMSVSIPLLIALGHVLWDEQAGRACPLRVEFDAILVALGLLGIFGLLRLAAWRARKIWGKD
jgi:hypothetical protein